MVPDSLNVYLIEILNKLNLVEIQNIIKALQFFYFLFIY